MLRGLDLLDEGLSFQFFLFKFTVQVLNGFCLDTLELGLTHIVHCGLYWGRCLFEIHDGLLYHHPGLFSKFFEIVFPFIALDFESLISLRVQCGYNKLFQNVTLVMQGLKQRLQRLERQRFLLSVDVTSDKVD